MGNSGYIGLKYMVGTSNQSVPEMAIDHMYLPSGCLT